MRIIFMGTPDFAAESLKSLIDNKFEVVAVFSQPDKPKGRGMEVQPTPVKAIAEASGIPVYQPVKLRDGTALSIIKKLAPDIIVVVAYGRIIPDEILEVPVHGAVNVHGSLLPKYRGAAPIQWAVLNGDSITGVSTMYLATEMDTGDIIYQRETPIGEYETSGQLFDRLSVMGAELLIKTLNDIETGIAPRTPQNHSTATYTKMLDKTFSPIEWDAEPRSIIKHIYGLQPWPVATMTIADKVYKVFDAEYTDNLVNEMPGSIVSANSKGIEVCCAGGKTIRVTTIQAPGKKKMSVSDFLKGNRLF